jgi:hypothetical protein
MLFWLIDYTSCGRALERTSVVLEARLPNMSTGPPAQALPLKARHVEWSAIASAVDDPAEASPRVLELALQAAGLARSISMRAVVERMTRPPYYPDVWPGEHYKLLAALVAVLRPRLVIEIGTATGLSALAMRTQLPAGSRLATFDIIPWRRFPERQLRDEDFGAE